MLVLIGRLSGKPQDLSHGPCYQHAANAPYTPCLWCLILLSYKPCSRVLREMKILQVPACVLKKANVQCESSVTVLEVPSTREIRLPQPQTPLKSSNPRAPCICSPMSQCNLLCSRRLALVGLRSVWKFDCPELLVSSPHGSWRTACCMDDCWKKLLILWSEELRISIIKCKVDVHSGVTISPNVQGMRLYTMLIWDGCSYLWVVIKCSCRRFDIAHSVPSRGEDGWVRDTGLVWSLVWEIASF